jgi:hypothetical protein
VKLYCGKYEEVGIIIVAFAGWGGGGSYEKIKK